MILTLVPCQARRRGNDPSQRLYSSPAAAEPLRRHRVTAPGRAPSQAAAGRDPRWKSPQEPLPGLQRQVRRELQGCTHHTAPRSAPLGRRSPRGRNRAGWTALPGRPRGRARAGTVPAAPPGGGCTYPPAKRCTSVSLWLILAASTRAADGAPGRFRPAHGSA